MARNKVHQYTVPKGGRQDDRISDMLKKLELESAAAYVDRLADTASKNKETYRDFLEGLLEVEMNNKEEHRITRWVQQARFPSPKTLKQFDFTFQPTANQRLLNELASCRFIEEGKNVFFFGNPGVGKTHLAIALGYEAINKGFEARFLKLNQLIDLVEKKVDVASSQRFLKTLLHKRLLILDDIDFYDTGRNASEFLFKLVTQRYDHKLSTIFTSNQPFGEWGKLFGSQSRAGATIDRIREREEIIRISGDSYRMRNKKKETQLAGIPK
jgi:DNA replication protein DnaC